MTKYQKQTFIDYVESLCVMSENIMGSIPEHAGSFSKILAERRELKTKFIKWFSKQIKS